jgi:hypothetical protein
MAFMRSNQPGFIAQVPHAELSAAAETSMKPSLSLRLSFLLRSERYRRLDADPVIRSRTSFFAAASVVTRVLAYGGTTPFMVVLSHALEQVNVSRARLICSGQLYDSGSVERNTMDFVRYEQALVQQALDGLCRIDPPLYSEQISIANGAIDRAMSRRAAYASSSLATFARAAAACFVRLGRAIEFSRQSDRQALGEELARRARPAR